MTDDFLLTSFLLEEVKISAVGTLNTARYIEE